ncbi:hypothetical protein, partial [Klebsiella pneumoniae]|uniref:hypothetical protein n=1 Tax=Klebsiella pneumoniae TaxID=573 RepID=UPI0038D3E366
LPGGTARGRTTWRVGSGSPGEALLPTPGMSAVPHAKKKPVLAYELFLKYGGEGGIDSLPGGTARGRTTWRVGSGSPGEALLPTPGLSA